jgi:NADPH2:quinone reductase
MTHSIRIYAHGGPEVLRWERSELRPPDPHEALVRHEAVGVNFIDIYHRSGLYPLPLPSGVGQAGAGIVEAVGHQVGHVAPGNRVAYCTGPPGSYCQVRTISADRLVTIPDWMTFETAAAVLLQGLTAGYLLLRTYPLRRGDTILIHAAAGGVGLIACQWAKALGVTVIGTTSSEAKATLARAHGADHVIRYDHEDVASRVRTLTSGEGVAVVYDGVGRATFEGSLDSLRKRGLLVSFGNSSGSIPPFEPILLSTKGSLYLTRPRLIHYAGEHAELQALASELFEIVHSGRVQVRIGQTYPLADAEQAQRDLEARNTTGSTVLLP